jgi:hypothetical protein
MAFDFLVEYTAAPPAPEEDELTIFKVIPESAGNAGWDASFRVEG